jgi:hypothetical protein
MDLKSEEIALYLSTLQAVIDIMNKMPNATIKKVRAMLEDEICHIRMQIEQKDN